MLLTVLIVVFCTAHPVVAAIGLYLAVHVDRFIAVGAVYGLFCVARRVAHACIGASALAEPTVVYCTIAAGHFKASLKSSSVYHWIVGASLCVSLVKGLFGMLRSWNLPAAGLVPVRLMRTYLGWAYVVSKLRQHSLR
jgi:hypothetical protein